MQHIESYTAGVNLGGWFIPEKWMTPELFENTGGNDTLSLLSTTEGIRRYKTHISTFILEQDFVWLSKQNVSFIRIPIAWWQFRGSCIGQEELDWAISMAEKYHIKVLLDYHGALGSQNGKDHSGASGKVQWTQHFDENSEILTRIAKRYASSPALWGIELLNEPVVKKHYFILLRFYRRVYRSLQAILPQTVKIVFHDGFHPVLFIGVLGLRRRIVMDMHLYELPLRSNDTLESYLQRRDRVYRRRIAMYGLFQQIMIGEWSAVLPQKFINERSDVQKRHAVTQNIQRQQALYSHATAAAFWSYRTNDTMMWNFQSLTASTQEVVK